MTQATTTRASPLRPTVAAVAALAALLALPATGLAAQVDGPSSAQPPGTHMFSTPPASPPVYVWTCDGVFSGTGPSTQCTFTTRGRHTAAVVVNGVDFGSAALDISVPPTVAIVGGPVAVHAGTVVALTASTAGGVGSVSYTWRLNGSTIKGPSAGSAGGDTASIPIASAGPNTISVTAAEQFSGGAVRTSEIAINGTNSRPTAAIDLTSPGPFAIRSGAATVRLDASGSNDPDGPGDFPLVYEWDFGDGTPATSTAAATTTHGYARSGAFVASVSVLDRFGARSTPRTVLVQVVPRLAARISPWPIVRVRGRFVRDGAQITRLTIKAPRGSVVRLRCTGRSCPYRARRKTASSSARVVRFNAMEKWMRAGTVIEVLVTKPGRTGKYTRLRIRSGRVPTRVDRCLIVGTFKRALCSRLG